MQNQGGGHGEGYPWHLSNSPRKSEEDSARRTPWSEGGNACQDLRRQLYKLQEARRQEDKEDKKEAMKQQKKGVASSSRQEAAEETEVKLPDAKGAPDEARGQEKGISFLAQEVLR